MCSLLQMITVDVCFHSLFQSWYNLWGKNFFSGVVSCRKGGGLAVNQNMSSFPPRSGDLSCDCWFSVMSISSRRSARLLWKYKRNHQFPALKDKNKSGWEWQVYWRETVSVVQKIDRVMMWVHGLRHHCLWLLLKHQFYWVQNWINHQASFTKFNVLEHEEALRDRRHVLQKTPCPFLV